MTRLGSVRVRATVALDPVRAFHLFTDEIDAWYVKNRSTLGAWAVDATIRFEGVDGGGRLVHVRDGRPPHVMAVVTAWEPGRRLVLLDADGCEVEVTFDAATAGTRVTLEQRGLARFEPDEPRARYGWRVLLPWFVAHTERAPAIDHREEHR